MSKAGNENITTRRAALGSLAAIAAMVPASAVAAAVCPSDPIYLLIEAHKTARAAFIAALKNEPPMIQVGVNHWKHVPEHDVWERNSFAPGDAEQEATVAMLTTAPTTLAGAVALLRYMQATDTDGEAYHNTDCGEAGDGFSALVGSLVVALAPLVVALAPLVRQ